MSCRDPGTLDYDVLDITIVAAACLLVYCVCPWDHFPSIGTEASLLAFVPSPLGTVPRGEAQKVQSTVCPRRERLKVGLKEELVG